MTQAVVDTDTPIHSAVYVPSTAKIIGTCENYLVRFDGTTGAFETSVKAESPMYGEMHMVLINNLPWVSANADMSIMSGSQPRRDVFPVNATTLALGAALGVDVWKTPTDSWPIGPTEMVSAGNILFYNYATNAGTVSSNVVNVTNTAIRTSNVTDTSVGFWSEHPSTDGTFWYIPNPSLTRLRQRTMTLANVDYCDFATYFPIASAYASNVAKPFCVCGTTDLLQVDDIPTNGFTPFNLGAIQAGVKPIRIRYNSVDGLLYIPCQNQDGIIVWNPNTSTGVWKSGFPSAVDVVFTPIKKFAVLSSADGIKEIT